MTDSESLRKTKAELQTACQNVEATQTLDGDKEIYWFEVSKGIWLVIS